MLKLNMKTRAANPGFHVSRRRKMLSQISKHYDTSPAPVLLDVQTTTALRLTDDWHAFLPQPGQKQ